MNKKAQGAKNRKKGRDFELKVRKHFEAEGWIVDKFSNNVDLEEGKFKVAGAKYIPGRGLMPGLGFPDFVMFKLADYGAGGIVGQYKLQFVEVKTNLKRLSKLEKQKLDWMVKQGYKCFVAFDDEGKIGIREFLEYKEQARFC